MHRFGRYNFWLRVFVCVLIDLRLHFLTSSFRLHSTDTIYWSGVRVFASRFFFSSFLSPGKTEQMMCESIHLPV